MSDARDRDDDDLEETGAQQPLTADAGVDADTADVLEQAQPLAAVEVTDLADGADVPFTDPGEEARLREDALEAEPPV